LASYAKLKAEGDTRFVAIPVALSKIFRHSCIYVRSDSGIKNPQDLRQRRVGVAQLDSTGIVFIKGMLQRDFGIHATEINWVVGGLEVPQVAPRSLPENHGSIKFLDGVHTLMSEFAVGHLDALFSNHIPSIFRNGLPSMRRLFPNFKAVERDYFNRTGILPVMHVVAIRSEVYRENPAVARNLYRAFCAARDIAISDLYDTDALRVSLPWLIDHVEEAKRVFGVDFWSYGLEPNRKAWDAICQYQAEQGIVSRRISADDLFVSVE
jgi:4,5-dihydroxyphthalate decarboxylase